MWALFFGGLFITTPLIGPVIALGYLAATAIAAIEGAVVIGGLSALGAALYSIGIPKDSVVRYEAAIADGFIVVVHGTSEEAARAKAILATANASSVDSHNTIGASKPEASAA